MRIFAPLFILAAMTMPQEGFSATTSVSPNGENKHAQVCFGCHGKNGVSSIETYPNLAGQKEKYIEIQLKAYREGSRHNDIMSPMAKSLTDQDIEILARYFSDIPKSN